MAITLTEAAKLSQDQLRRGVIETITEESPLMQRLPFITVQGNAYAYVREAGLGGAAFRAVNEGYTPSEGNFTKESTELARLGGEADVDRFLVQTQGGEVADLRAAVTAQKAKAVRLAFHNAFVNGTGTNDDFEGLDRVLSGSAQEIEAAADGMPIVGASSEDRHAFFDKVEELLASLDGEPAMLLMNRQTLAKFKSAARRESAYDETRDAFGKAISTYNGVPLVDAGVNEDGGQIIAQDEAQGTATDASSIYAVRFGDDGVAGITNGGVQVYDLGEVDDKPVFRTRIEFYCGLAVHKVQAAAVLRGVLAA